MKVDMYSPEGNSQGCVQSLIAHLFGIHDRILEFIIKYKRQTHAHVHNNPELPGKYSKRSVWKKNITCLIKPSTFPKKFLYILTALKKHTHK